jgi:hypothetical protein
VRAAAAADSANARLNPNAAAAAAGGATTKGNPLLLLLLIPLAPTGKLALPSTSEALQAEGSGCLECCPAFSEQQAASPAVPLLLLLLYDGS